MAGTSNFQKSQDTLYTLASDTGGKALLDNNDLAAGIVQAQKAMSSYYIIGYYTTNRSSGRQIPRDQDLAEQRTWPPSSITARATTPARSSASSPPPTRSGSSKTR